MRTCASRESLPIEAGPPSPSPIPIPARRRVTPGCMSMKRSIPGSNFRPPENRNAPFGLRQNSTRARPTRWPSSPDATPDRASHPSRFTDRDFFESTVRLSNRWWRAWKSGDDNVRSCALPAPGSSLGALPFQPTTILNMDTAVDRLTNFLGRPQIPRCGGQLGWSFAECSKAVARWNSHCCRGPDSPCSLCLSCAF